MKKTKKKTAKHADLIYDIGLHRGQDTEFYLKKGYRVIGFEANPDNVRVCRERFAQEIEAGKLTIIEGAIVESGNKANKTVFYKNLNSTFWGSTCQDWAYRNEVMGTTNEAIVVETVNFAECLEKYGIPFYLKADIVGSETVCLRALLDFENKPDYLSIRSEKVIFDKLLAEFELLTELGYDRFKAIQQGFTKQETVIKSAAGKDEKFVFEEGASGVFGEETAGKWKDYDQIIKQYRRIFVRYWLFGDYSYLTQTKRGTKIVRFLERVFRRPLPGWYDTHAKRSSSLLTLLYTLLETPVYL
jgi:FkbM family methyltransferase